MRLLRVEGEGLNLSSRLEEKCTLTALPTIEAIEVQDGQLICLGVKVVAKRLSGSALTALI